MLSLSSSHSCKARWPFFKSPALPLGIFWVVHPCKLSLDFWPDIGERLQRVEKSVSHIWKLGQTKKTTLMNRESRARKRSRKTVSVWWNLDLQCWQVFFYLFSSPRKLHLQTQMFPPSLCICSEVIREKNNPQKQQPGHTSVWLPHVCAVVLGRWQWALQAWAVTGSCIAVSVSGGSL